MKIYVMVLKEGPVVVVKSRLFVLIEYSCAVRYCLRAVVGIAAAGKEEGAKKEGDEKDVHGNGQMLTVLLLSSVVTGWGDWLVY